jgi:orotidine-5'-phosphate decarboxylase
MPDPKIIIALDFDNAEETFGLVKQLKPEMCRLKVGKELFTTVGPALVERLVGDGFDVFLDLKFHDIPHTVAAACKAAARMGVWMVNVHALGGRKMLLAAREALEGLSERPKLIAVTVLTSMDKEDLLEIGMHADPQDVVLRLAKLAQSCALDGVVCSGHEAALLKRELGQSFRLVTPGIRPANAVKDDQNRVMTPSSALRAGADYLVVGRPITRAEYPLSVLDDMNNEIRLMGERQ